LRTATINSDSGKNTVIENSMCNLSPAIHLSQLVHRLSWEERLTRNARAKAAGPVNIKLFGMPDQFADFLGSQQV
jgi:hypothetical protein